MLTPHLFLKQTFVATVTLLGTSWVFAQDSDANLDTGELIVIGVTPTDTLGLREDQIPFYVQSATSDDIEQSQSLDITEFLNRNIGSISINDAQNNPLQPDVQFRGFTLSPLLGLPQGLSVFQNGVRVNEPFGDSFNFDLIPESAIASIDLVSGANPLFGLNTLGGALSIKTKNGFTHPGTSVEVYGGSFERFVTNAETGWNNGRWGYFVTANYFDEEGFRDASPSDALNFYSTFGFRGDDTEFDVSFTYGNTDLIGNGAIPVELEAADRDAVFTSPDQTRNSLGMLIAEASHWVNDELQISGNAFFRRNETNSFNGDGTEFSECDFDPGDINGEFLIDGIDEDDLPDACENGTATVAAIEALGGEVVEDQQGNFVEAENDNDTERNAINNISVRDSKGFGGTVQTTFLGDLFNRQNQFIFGAAYQQGIIDFSSRVEVASLSCEFFGNDCAIPSADRSTIASGLFVPEEGNAIKSHNRVWSIFLSDTISITDDLNLTLSGRYNNSSIVLGDRSSSDPLADPDDPQALNGEHDYNRFNPALGLTYNLTSHINLFGGYSESSRAPTPVELLCADEDAPCSLPNAFLADPPLDQVVTKSYEGGVRGTFNKVRYSLSGFHSVNNDDIIFTSTGGIGSNEGFFRNVGDTRRLGVELGLSGSADFVDWFFNYSFVEATFQTGFQAASANHPLADANGEISVEKGDRIPGIPEHTLKLGGVFHITSKWDFGVNALFNSDQFIRGDEANLLEPLKEYVVVNVNTRYRFNEHLTAFARINNLLDTDYETFGLIGEPDEVFPNFNNPQFVGVAPPIAGFVGFKYTF